MGEAFQAARVEALDLTGIHARKPDIANESLQTFLWLSRLAPAQSMASEVDMDVGVRLARASEP